MKNKLLKELKGKIIELCFYQEDKNLFETHMVRLVSFDDSILKVEGWNKNIYYIPISACMRFNESLGVNKEKFMRYEEEYELNNSFEADDEGEDRDKGYTVIKRKNKNE